MRRRRAPRARLVGFGLLTGSLWIMGLGSAFAAAPRDPEAEIERLRARVVELEREATVGRVETARLRAELTRLETELDEARKRLEAARRQGPETVAEAEPTGPIVETGPAIEEAPLEDEMLVGVAVAEPLSAPAEPPVPEAQPEPEAAAVPAAGEAPPQVLYDEGYTLFHEKRYDEAEKRFERFLTFYPTSSLADNALFWIGECRYARGEFQAALEAFTGTVERFPEGNKVPDAMVKAGKCFEALGDLDSARETYDEIRRRFPATGAATLAAEHLKTLGSKPSP